MTKRSENGEKQKRKKERASERASCDQTPAVWMVAPVVISTPALSGGTSKSNLELFECVECLFFMFIFKWLCGVFGFFGWFWSGFGGFLVFFGVCRVVLLSCLVVSQCFCGGFGGFVILFWWICSSCVVIF